MKKSIKIALALLLASNVAMASDQFSMSEADKAMYAEMLENNPADIMIESGSELLEANVGGNAGLAKFLKVSEDELPKMIASFPRYMEEFKMVVGLDQMLQGAMSANGHKPFTLKSKEMFEMSSYVKSIANGEPMSIDIHANKHMEEAYALGEKTFAQKRGGRGLSCMSCHSPDAIGMLLRTQGLPDLGAPETKAAATWPAYRMTKSALTTLQKRFQGCMENALLAVIPLGSKEMVGLEVYVTEKSKGHTIAIPGLKR
ncbi:MAG: sulfur oxidation c-type cytochrome SoxA [Epsilonproteobacteria bacterium]|nr:sulfur oxidation c-type cytochrome SoxA [Campylobacterota bacterium]